VRLPAADEKKLRSGERAARETAVPAARRQEVQAERAVARIAAGQHGIVTTAQMLAAGFGYGAISRRAATGWLVRRHQAVYQVGVFGGPFGTETAALLACGDEAVLSDRSAMAVWGPCVRDEALPVDVITSRRGRAGIRVHDRKLAPGDITVRHGMRITTPTRTLLDLASSMPAVELQRLFEEAQVRRLVSASQLATALGVGSRGAKRLRELVEPELGYTRSEAERRLRALVKKAALPPPRTNFRIAGLEVDAVWPPGSSSRSTATPTTARARPSSVTGGATRGCSWPATACCASRGIGSRRSRSR
jgi:Transcriptional regulator, AbiEi antitoxin